LVRHGGRFENRLYIKSLHSRLRKYIKKTGIGDKRGNKIDKDPYFTLLKLKKRKRI
jgi:hypothetical protein